MDERSGLVSEFVILLLVFRRNSPPLFNFLQLNYSERFGCTLETTLTAYSHGDFSSWNKRLDWLLCACVSLGVNRLNIFSFCLFS